MGVTRFTLYAGLAGLWIIRDERERELDLPEGAPFEVPLLLQDRNFGEDARGRLNRRAVHKTDPGTMEAFAPFTTVNGKVWPFLLDVQTGRATACGCSNGSNARTFPPGPAAGRVCPNSAGSLRSAPTAGTAYRAYLDLTCRRSDSCSPRPSAPTCSSTSPTSSRGGDLTLLNTRVRAVRRDIVPSGARREAADLDWLLPYPDVMRFRVVPGPSKRGRAAQRLGGDFTPPSPADLAAAVHRTVALVEH